MTEPPVPHKGRTLILGPSQTGKTRRTARALESWIDEEGTDGVVVLDFAPEFERDGTILGGRLDRFTTIPDAVWYGVIEAHAPRAAGETPEETQALARENATRARQVIDACPDPIAAFVNDATIPFQHDSLEPERLTNALDSADHVVLNAFESEELGTDDPVSRREKAVLDEFRAWSDRTIDLG